MVSGTLEFDMRVKDFIFKNEKYFRGNIILTKKPKKIRFTYHLDKNISSNLLDQRERMINFHFTLEMKPDIGEINFDGDCKLESPEQNKIQFCLQNQVPPFIKFIDRIILKECYKNCKKIAEENNIPFPPVDFLMKVPEKK